MFKFLVVPLNLMFIFLLNAILSEDIKIEHEHPSGIASLGECEVAVTFEKGKVIGFAKYIQPIPKGVEVESIETNGGSFTFQQGSIKVIWMALPKEEKFTIKYKLKATDPYLDKIELGGTFTYLDQNKRMTFDAQKKVIAVGGKVPIEEETQEEAQEEQPTASASTGASRDILALGNNKYKMNINVNKASVNGFAKIQDFFPSGAKVSEDNSNGAVFTVVDKKAKFVWMELPSGESFDISYIIDLANASDKDPSSIFGEFSYLQEGQTQKVKIGSGTTSEEMMANNEPAEEEVIEEEPVQKPTPRKKTPRKTFTQNVTSTPAPQNGVNYRVQILAGHKNVGAAYFNTNHSYSGQFYVENHEGWVKYTTGSFGVYRQARDKRNNITSQYNFPGPFVVAYNDGDRITVQEALMITNQKWLK